jgi:signal transduction histidine kinase
MVNGDGDLLVEIVRSLLDNACRFTPPEEEGGWIWAEVRQEENDAVLEIINEVYDRVLSPAILAQLNDPKGKPFSGRKSTGYGTRLCDRIVQLHQGSLEYHNTGMGLSAEIRLPLAFEGYVK